MHGTGIEMCSIVEHNKLLCLRVKYTLVLMRSFVL